MLARLGLLLLVLVGAVPLVAAQCVNVGTRCLLFVDFGTDTHADAEALCGGLNSDGVLVMVKNAAFMKDILDYINTSEEVPANDTSFWIDGTRDLQTNQFNFTDMNPVPDGTPFWAATPFQYEPSADGDCISLSVENSLYMTATNCNSLLYSICDFGAAKLSDKEDGDEYFQETETTEVECSVQCSEPFVCVGSQCLAFLQNEDSGWEGAEGLCKLLGGDLAVVDDIQQLRNIYLYIQENQFNNVSFWLAGSDIVSEGAWTWLDGTSLPEGAPFWGLSTNYELEPLQDSNKNCLGLQADGRYFFRSVDCHTLQYPLCMGTTETLTSTAATTTAILDF